MVYIYLNRLMPIKKIDKKLNKIAYLNIIKRIYNKIKPQQMELSIKELEKMKKKHFGKCREYPENSYMKGIHQGHYECLTKIIKILNN